MTDPEDGLDELQGIYPGSKEMPEGGFRYIYIPMLKLPKGNNPAEVEALLCLSARDGYPTRLFLSSPISTKASNWTVHHILDRPWHTWSWKDVSADLRPTQILAAHLRALR